MGHLYSTHGLVAKTDQCRWETLNNNSPAINNIMAASNFTINLQTATNSNHQYQHKNSVLFKFICNIKSFNGSDYILEASKERDPNQISYLTIECENVISNDDSVDVFTENMYKVAHQMIYLRNFNLEFCCIQRLPDNIFAYFRTLRVLKIYNYCLDGSNLELYSNSFWGLFELTELDLSWNNIWSVPSNAFCTLPMLNKLNLSHNSLTELTQLNFSHKNQQNQTTTCTYKNISELDVSYNKITTIFFFDLSMLHNLKLLLLNNNHVQDINEFGLHGLSKLQYVDLTNNHLVVLSPSIFRVSTVLSKLVIRNNSLNALTPNVFDGLDQLEVLDLSYNRFTSTWVNGFIFARFINLVALNLAHNWLIKIDEFMFYDFKKLQLLDLSANQIDTIHEKAFSNLLNLKFLNLAFNKLRTLEKAFFSSGVDAKLIELSLESNLISNFHADFFQGMTNLQDLNLCDNLLIELPVGMIYLKALKSLDLGKNHIHFLDGEKFEGLNNLLGLRLIDNYITNLTSACFCHLPSLWVLNLGSNRLKFIDRTTFQHNPFVHVIRFDNNQIEDISNIFQSIKSLVWLNISDNKIKEFDFQYIPSRLEWLDMHKNKIFQLSDYEMQKNNARIRYLDVSENQLTYINDLSVPDNVEELVLNDNRISDIHGEAFHQKSYLRKVDLKNNELRQLSRDAMKIASNLTKPEMLLAGNPINCNCHTEWLKDVNKMQGFPYISDISSINCSVDNFRTTNYYSRQLTLVSRDQFLCQYEGHCLNNCHCCEFDACDCKFICPNRCDCYYDEFWRVNIVDCGRSEYFQIPISIPMFATVIFLDGNDFGNLADHIFLGKKALTDLYLNNSQTASIHNRTFAGIINLQRLHLENNFIQTINELMFEMLENLIELFLNGNSIEYVPELIFKSHRTLKLINFSSNRLVSMEFIHHLPKKTLIASSNFKNNPFACECSSTDNIRILKLIDMLCPMNKCRTNANVGATTTLVTDQLSLIKREYIQALAAILVAVIGTTFLLSIVYIFRENFMLFLFTNYNIRVQRDPTEIQQLSNDSIILFNNRDSDFVYRILSLQLENRSFKVYHQDSIVRQGNMGTSNFSYDYFLENIELSKRLIIVISSNFLNFEWKNADFKMALQNYLLRINRALRPYRIILVIAVPIDILLLDPILELMAESCTRLFWDEENFWEKLYYAMPDPDKYKMITISKKVPSQQSHSNSPRYHQPAKDCEESYDDELSIDKMSKLTTPQTYTNKASGHIYTTIAVNSLSPVGESNSKQYLHKSQTTLNFNGVEVEVAKTSQAYFV